MAEIWEQRYTNEKGKRESAKVFDMFQIFLEQKQRPRSLKKLTLDLYFNGDDSEEIQNSTEFHKKYNSIQRNSSNYDWFDRVNAHDTYWRKYRNKIKNDFIAEKEVDELITIFERMEAVHKNHKEFCEEDTEMVVVGDSLQERPIRKTAKIHSDNEYINSNKALWETIYLIKNGGTLKTSNKNNDSVKVSADVKAKLDNKTIFDIVNKELGLDED